MFLYRNHEQVAEDNRSGWEPFHAGTILFLCHHTDGGVHLFLSSAKERTIYVYIPRCH